MKKKNYEPMKHLIRGLEGLSILVALAAVFVYEWYKYFNPMMAKAFQNKGNILMIAVYFGILCLMFQVFGGFKVGLYKRKSVALSQILGILGTNVICYIQIVLMIGLVKKMVIVAEIILIMSLCQIAISMALIFVETNIFQKIYPPKKMLVLYETRTVNRIIEKLQTRDDKYIILEKIKVDENWIENIEKETDYDAVLIYDISSPLRNDVLKYCYARSIRVYMIPKISDIIIHNAPELQLFDTPILLTRDYCMTSEQAIIKRIIDIIVSLIGIIVTSPIMAVTAILIKAYDGGTAIYSQERCTKDGKVFRIMKFRSMIMDAEKDGVARLATESDKRITPIGKFIRKTRIDELPQFFNVLHGEMSIVGPRPERPEIVEEYCEEIPEFRYRMKVKAGLTGYAQVYGKYNTTAYDKLKWDLMYIQKYSIGLDLKLIIMTIKIIFMKESTQGLSDGERVANTKVK